MSRITAVSLSDLPPVYIEPRQSLVARIIQVSLILLLIWGLLIAALPLPPSLYLISFLIRYKPRVDTDMRWIRLDSRGKIRTPNRLYRVRHHFSLYKWLMIRITTMEGSKVTIWRDSCPDREYRHLIVMLSILAGNKRGAQVTPK